MSSVSVKTCTAREGYIGEVPVRNLWLLMLYASDLFRQLGNENLAVEESPDDIPDLVAELLAHTVERRLKRNLSFGYQPREQELGRVRGQIDLLRTERRRLLDRGRVACRFEELTANTPRNRYVRAALERLTGIVRRKDLARRCKELAGTLRRLGVRGEKPSRAVMSTDRYSHNDAGDRRMVDAAHLAFDLALLTEDVGKQQLALPDRDTTWVRRLYEKAVAGFYDVALSKLGWRAEAGRTLRWSIDRKTPGIDKILPSMRTDIILEHLVSGRRLIIDTKFTSIVTEGWYREQSLRSGYLYQMYAYLRSQEDDNNTLSTSASGILLHPSVGVMVNEHVVIQGHQLRFATVDLTATAKEIRNQLLHVIGVVSFTD